MNDLKREVTSFTTEIMESIETTNSVNTDIENNEGESPRYSLYNLQPGIDEINSNQPNNYIERRQFDVLDDSYSSQRRDICDYGSNISISGQKRKHPVAADDNDGEVMYNPTDITKKLNDPSYSSDQTVSIPKIFNDQSFSSPAVTASRSNSAHKSATVDLLSDSD